MNYRLRNLFIRHSFYSLPSLIIPTAYTVPDFYSYSFIIINTPCFIVNFNTIKSTATAKYQNKSHSLLRSNITKSSLRNKKDSHHQSFLMMKVSLLLHVFFFMRMAFRRIMLQFQMLFFLTQQMSCLQAKKLHTSEQTLVTHTKHHKYLFPDRY